MTYWESPTCAFVLILGIHITRQWWIPILTRRIPFCRYVVMHRSTFWRFKRMGQVNIYLRLGRKGKLLTLTLRKPQKLVSIVHFMYYSCCKVYTFITHICFFFLSALALPQVSGSCQSSSALLESGFIQGPDSSSMLISPITGAVVHSWSSVQTANLSHETKGEIIKYIEPP